MNRKGRTSSPPALVGATPPPFSRAVRAASLLFDAAMRVTGTANQGAGDAAGLSERFIRNCRDGEDATTLPMPRALMLPRGVFYALLRELPHAYERLHGAPLTGSTESQTHVLIGAALDAIKVLHTSVSDGRIDAHEVPEMLGAIDTVEEHCARLRRLLHKQTFGGHGVRDDSRADDHSGRGGVH